ncbi:ATP-binding cassette domain-containing protein [bacterium]|nr:ATP-binding cassette domain-containing protein [bacterium]
MGDIAIQVSNLTKLYGKTLAVDRINFEVKKGEIFGFLGPNGAGKTTTQRILTGIIKANSGTVSIMGLNIETESFYAKRQIGVVPEIANVYIDLSAWNNLMLIGSLYGLSKKNRIAKAEELLKLFNLYERKDEKTKTFSKGMKQRLLLAMALMSEPKVLFLDEPTSGLDVQSCRLIREKILEFNRHDMSIFLTTHNITEADQMCNRVAIVNHGKIAVIDTPEKLKKEFQFMQVIEVLFNKEIQNKRELEKMRGISKIQKVNDKFKIYTDDTDCLIREIINFSHREKLKIISLNTLAPNLEEVFLKIVEEHKSG